ncbi:MAG: hypothetical protein V4864_05605 [Pseudomonadota bacterium]
MTKVDVLLGDTVTITSKSAKSLLVRSAVANDNDGNSSCDKAIGKSLAPGESTTLIFMGCGDAMELAVRTDQGGSATFKFSKK